MLLFIEGDIETYGGGGDDGDGKFGERGPCERELDPDDERLLWGRIIAS